MESIKKWYCDKYGIDILEERLRLIEFSGSDVINFIKEYLKDLKNLPNKHETDLTKISKK